MTTHWYLGLAVLAGLSVTINSDVWAEQPFAYGLQQIPVGTEAVDSDADRFNRLILLARPALTSGEIDLLPEGFDQAVTRFSYTVMVTVSRLGDGDAPFRLYEVGLGYSELQDGRQVIVTGDSDGASKLGLIDRRVLSQSETNLKSSRIVVRSSTLMMFDLTVLMSRPSGHQMELHRNLIWVNPNSGDAAMAIWSLGPGSEVSQSGKSLTVSDDPIQIHLSGSRVINRLHVDGHSLLLGIPTPKTFANERLLPGAQIEWTSMLREVAGRPSYSKQMLASLTAALNDAM